MKRLACAFHVAVNFFGLGPGGLGGLPMNSWMCGLDRNCCTIVVDGSCRFHFFPSRFFVFRFWFLRDDGNECCIAVHVVINQFWAAIAVVNYSINCFFSFTCCVDCCSTVGIAFCRIILVFFQIENGWFTVSVSALPAESSFNTIDDVRV